MNNQPFFATAALGLEPLLATELAELGAAEVKQERAGVSFSGDLRIAYRACLWSRLASRVLLPLARFAVEDGDQLYAQVRDIDWDQHLDCNGTLAVDCNLSRSRLSHSRFAALRVKDAIVDQFRQRQGQRPSVSLHQPDLRLNLYVHHDQAVLSLDLSGESLHRRGYRADGMQAPLKENLAAAILIRADWPAICACGGGLIDPMCGSGSLPLEAALMACDVAPGLLRDYFGFLAWRGHDRQLWEQLVKQAAGRREAGRGRSLPPIVGYDAERRAIKLAWEHARTAGLDLCVHFERRTLHEFIPLNTAKTGLLVANPPYGERLGSAADLPALYNLLGEQMATQLPNWKAAVITSDSQLGRSIGLRAGKINTLYNGALKCQLLQFDLTADNRWQSLVEGAGGAVKKPLTGGAEMLANRLRKNLKKLAKWARREQVDCYRLYDADLPEYAVAVDLYADQVHVQEYRAPKQIPLHQAAARLAEVMTVLPQVLAVAPEKIHLKVRQQQKGREQYHKCDQRGQLLEVKEGNCRFWVNLSDYLDTGLFLDQRPTRRLIQQLAGGQSFLNLFAYTGTATVHALLGGAKATTTVDMSRTYLEWAEKNLVLNQFEPAAQELIQADCLTWLAEVERTFDLIFLDPPTFSNSKSMRGHFDVQRDHVTLINQTVDLLAPGGTLIFSNNLRTFKIDRTALSGLDIEDISAQTIPFDFQRNPRIHNCWLMRRSADVPS